MDFTNYFIGFMLVLFQITTLIYGVDSNHISNSEADKNVHSNVTFVNLDHQPNRSANVFQVLAEEIQKIPVKLGLKPEDPAHPNNPAAFESILAKEVPAAELEKLKEEQKTHQGRSVDIIRSSSDEDPWEVDDEIMYLPHEADPNDRKARALGLDFGAKNDIQDNSLFQAVRVCGYSPRASPTRLSNVSPGQFPWAAAILSADNRFLCSGTLISESIILTTASCILTYQTINQPLKVRLGAWSLPDGHEYLPQLDVNVRAAVLHPLYNQAGSASHDIGLLRLAGNIDFDLNPQIFPICVISPSDEAIASINSCLITGWPDLPEMQPWRSRAFLRWGSVSVSRSTCPVLTPDSCANGQACVGNRGSPLICLANSQRYYVWGLVPQDMNCNPGASVANVPIVSVIDNYDFISRYLNTPNPVVVN